MATKEGFSDSDGIVSSGTAGIHVEGLGKEYDTKQGRERVFEDINIDIEPGSFVTLVGRSGCGKSTLLNIISDVLEPTEGRVYFADEQGNEIEAKLGHVFQSPRLLPWRDAVANIRYVNENNPDYTDDLARKNLDMVGLADQYDKYPSQLSGGQRQRVGIARALSIDPDVLLMDEPFSNLDEITAEQLRIEVMDLWKQLEKTVLFVTHDLTEAIQLSERIIMLGGGSVYDDVDVPLPYPREVDDEDFLVFRKQVLDRFHEGNPAEDTRRE